MDNTVAIIKFHCKIDSEIQYYLNQKGSIKGIKKINNNLFLYLIEFFNHNRIWVIKQEFTTYNNRN